ncbi:MAG: FtsX-like permease family protein, partial [Acidobacteria bacterium]|nr:FtsX-like permease family protein [Acidobacteriota bacterium]
GTIAASLRRTLRDYDPALPVLRANTFAEHLGEELFMPRVAAGFLGGFSLVALALAALGLYAVVAFSVAQRRMEVGIRMALGAGSAQVLWMIVRQVMLTVVIGLALGIGLALAVMPSLVGMLYKVSAKDPLTLAGVTGLLAVVALIATLIPARRAASSDPVSALRV